MDENEQRAQTLQALEVFVETQKRLLARQRADIESLQRLKNDLTRQPSQILAQLTEELSGTEFRLSEQADCRLSLPKEIQWASFRNSDLRSLQNFAQRHKDEQVHRSQPLPFQRSSLSDLQKLVKHARRTIIDPILLRFQDMSSPEPESEEEIDPVERRREAERQKIRELKKRQIRGGLSLPLSSMAGSMGVFIRHDVDDEAMDVDVSIDDGEEGTGSPTIPKRQPPPRPHAGKAYATKVLPPASPPPPLKRQSNPKISAKPRKEKPPETSYVPRKRATNRARSPAPDPEEDRYEDEEDNNSENSDDEDVDLPPSKPVKEPTRVRKVKPKPETYKQAWSASEQNLLEQLLDEIPEGERFRWQKISKAMGGRRTPRQVASRVQKYFEKLKKFSLL